MKKISSLIIVTIIAIGTFAQSYIEIKDINRSEFFSYQNDSIYKVDDLIKTFLTKKLSKGTKAPKYIYYGIENTMQRNDSVINYGYFKTSNILLDDLK